MSRRSRLVTFIQSVLIRCSFRQRRQNRPAAIVTRVLLTCVLALIPTDFAMQQQAMLYAHAPMMMPVAPNAFMPTADVARQRAVFPYSPYHGVFPTPPMSPTSTPLPPNYLQMPPALKHMDGSPGNHQNSQEYHSPPKYAK